jgi:hypothetical protein
MDENPTFEELGPGAAFMRSVKRCRQSQQRAFFDQLDLLSRAPAHRQTERTSEDYFLVPGPHLSQPLQA